MPHVIVKLWPGKSEQQKQRLADAIAKEVMSVLTYGEESFSVAIEEISSADWADKVYRPDIVATLRHCIRSPDTRCKVEGVNHAGNYFVWSI